ncbi:MAG: DM13 domain-containing protein [Actinomycetota bacterium]|jgi:hypothetical protein
MRTKVTTFCGRFLRWEFVPEAVLAVGLTIFFLDQTDAATSAFKSRKAVAIMVAVTVGWLAGRLLLARFLRFAVARAAVFSVAAAVALAVVVLPAYNNETVIETFPAAAAPGPVPVTATTPSSAPVASADPPATPRSPGADGPAAGTPPRMPMTTSTTARAASAPTTGPATVSAAPAPTTTTTASAQPESASATPAEPEPAQSSPQRLRTGMFRGIDHRASGTVVIYRQPDGRYVVGLEDIDIQPGPDYDLYIVPGEDREDTKGGIRLGDLRGNRGTQFYEVPEGVNLESGPWTVLVWCQTFAVPVAGATPA